MNGLIAKLKNKNLIDEQGNIILEQTENSIQAVDVQTFETFFGDKPMDYENLTDSHTFTWNGETLTRTAEELGYKRFFDEWKEKGIIE